MPEAKERVTELLDRFNELHQKTRKLQETVSRLSAQIPTTQQERTDEYLSAKQAETTVRETEARLAEARAKVCVAGTSRWMSAGSRCCFLRSGTH